MTHLWRGPTGRIHSTTGKTAHDAANGLGRVVGWTDEKTVAVMYQGKVTEFTLQERGS